MVSVTSNGDVPQQPMNFDNSYIPDQLIAGVFPRVTQGLATVLHAATVNSVTPLPRGTIMGQQTIGSASVVAGTNTGTGTFTMDGTTPILPNAKVGAYVLTILATGRAQLVDPKGVSLGEYDFTSAGSVTIANEIKGVLADTSTHFVAGDKFTITVAAGSGKYVPSVATATDGSQVPSAILVDQTDPSAADVNAGLYFTGEFNSNAITFDSSWTVATLTPLLRPLGIYLKDSVSAADPT